MTQHTQNSSYREKLIEHLFIGELLKLSWLDHNCSLEISKPEVDNSGYDLIAESNGIIRHIQLKTSVAGASTASQKIHTKLAGKPGGCVVWIIFKEETLKLGPFLFFGDFIGQQLPRIDKLKIAKHTRGNKDGIKAERPNIRILPKKAFKEIKSIKNIYSHLFEKG